MNRYHPLSPNPAIQQKCGYVNMLAAQGKLCQAAPDRSGSLGVCSGGGRGKGWSGWVGVTPSWGVSCLVPGSGGSAAGRMGVGRVNDNNATLQLTVYGSCRDTFYLINPLALAN